MEDCLIGFTHKLRLQLGLRIEILKQMLRKVDITDPGDSDFILGEQAEFSKVRETNIKLKNEKKDN